MVKLLIDLLDFLRSCAPLLTSLIILTILCVLLSKSIRKHSTIYYVIFAIPFFLVAIPFIARLTGVEMTGFTRIPFLGEIIRDYIHMGTFGHPLLIIIMYMGALSPKIPAVNKLLSIRKELSIISGSAVFTHSLIRVANNFPNSLKFFTNNAEYMANTKVVSELGAGISSFSFVLGIIMLALFIPLWVTSFGGIRKRMGYAKWKKLQKWSYVLYVTLFIHAMGIQIGGLMNPRGGHAPKSAVETTVAQGQGKQSEATGIGGNNGDKIKPTEERPSGQGETTRQPEGRRQGGHEEAAKQPESNKPNDQVAKQATSGRTPTKGFSDIKVSSRTKGYIHIISLLLIYGSYLFLRLRKAKKDAERKSESRQANI